MHALPTQFSVLQPDWPVPKQVKACTTLRSGGISAGPYRGLNVGDHVGDDPVAVMHNQRLLSDWVGLPIVWPKQVHGCDVLVLAEGSASPSAMLDMSPIADAVLTRDSHQVCAIQTADCLPVLFSDTAGTVVAAAHAGWRGLSGGVLQSTLEAMRVLPAQLLVWLGPAIGPQVFEVGDDVREAFLAQDPHAAPAFHPSVNPQGEARWLADLYFLARQILVRAGVSPHAIFGGESCTFSEPERFFSYRRDRVTGRFATLIWLQHTAL